MSPWVSFEETGVTHQIYLKNERSLSKNDLVRQNIFAGYGYWALGYEG
jgi:spore germination protein YaaH